MSQAPPLKRPLIKCSHSNPQDVSYIFWCVGCKEYHPFITSRSPENVAEIKKLLNRDNPPIWSFNGNMEKPTFSPSLLCQYPHGDPPQPRVCHLFLVDGMIQYLTDCTHEYAGKTVPLSYCPEE